MTMTNHSVEKHLGLAVEDYDREIRRLVPHYDELVAEALTFLRALVAPDAHVLDVGSGTGRLAAAVLGAMPQAKVTLLDVDAKMLDEARRRLAGYDAGRVTFVSGSFYDPLPSCDAIVASLSLHHIEDLDRKTSVYRRIHEALPRGAPFLCLDASVSADPALAALTFERWAASMGDHGIDAATARQHFASWAREERYFSIHEELGALSRAGFAQPECFWRKAPVAIYGGRRAH